MRETFGVWVVLTALSLIVGTASSEETAGRTESFFIRLPEDGIAITHGGNMALGAGPPGIPFLSDARINSGLALLSKVRNRDGEVVGFASELETFPPGSDLLQENIVWDTDWTLMIPGRGSLYLREQETSNELGKRVIQPTRESGQPWRGNWVVKTTVGPRPDGMGVIVGGAGEFEGASGTFAEIVTLTGFDLPGILIGSVEIRLNFDPTEP